MAKCKIEKMKQLDVSEKDFHGDNAIYCFYKKFKCQRSDCIFFDNCEFAKNKSPRRSASIKISFTFVSSTGNDSGTYMHVRCKTFQEVF
jgi:hypothetical protein